jgi:hypothetical protein
MPRLKGEIVLPFTNIIAPFTLGTLDHQSQHHSLSNANQCIRFSLILVAITSRHRESLHKLFKKPAAFKKNG